MLMLHKGCRRVVRADLADIPVPEASGRHLPGAAPRTRRHRRRHGRGCYAKLGAALLGPPAQERGVTFPGGLSSPPGGAGRATACASTTPAVPAHTHQDGEPCRPVGAASSNAAPTGPTNGGRPPPLPPCCRASCLVRLHRPEDRRVPVEDLQAEGVNGRRVDAPAPIAPSADGVPGTVYLRGARALLLDQELAGGPAPGLPVLPTDLEEP